MITAIFFFRNQEYFQFKGFLVIQSLFGNKTLYILLMRPNPPEQRQ